MALFGRAEARDFADVYKLAQRFGKERLIEQARALDAGFDLDVLDEMLRTIDRFDDQDIPLAAEELPQVRMFFSDWSTELG